MRQIILLLAFLPISCFACVVGPTQLQVSKLNGFKVIEKPAEYYESTNEIEIVAPLKYNGEAFELGIFTVFLNGVLVAKSIHSSHNESGLPEFSGYVSNKHGFTYSVSFLYGEGRCKSYEFTTSNGGG